VDALAVEDTSVHGSRAIKAFLGVVPIDRRVLQAAPCQFGAQFLSVLSRCISGREFMSERPVSIDLIADVVVKK
jgi:hypothetical protein